MITALRPILLAELDLDELAHDIARCGITCVEPAVRAVAEAAARVGACSVLVRLVADPSAPRAARERAFGRLAVFLATRQARPVPVPELLCA